MGKEMRVLMPGGGGSQLAKGKKGKLKRGRKPRTRGEKEKSALHLIKGGKDSRPHSKGAEPERKRHYLNSIEEGRTTLTRIKKRESLTNASAQEKGYLAERRGKISSLVRTEKRGKKSLEPVFCKTFTPFETLWKENEPLLENKGKAGSERTDTEKGRARGRMCCAPGSEKKSSQLRKGGARLKPGELSGRPKEAYRRKEKGKL